MASLVVGGTGFVGRRLCQALIDGGVDFVATTRRPASTVDIPGVQWRRLNLATYDQWDRLLAGIDTVYHLAWSTIPSSAVLDPASDLSDNVVGSIRLLEAARKRPGIRIVFASSGGTVYGAVDALPVGEDHPAFPVSAYGLSKLVVERYIENYRATYGLDGVALRFANCYGAGQRSERGLGAVTLFARAALKGEPITIFGDGEVVRDYVHVDDIVAALLAAARRRKTVGPMNIGSGVGHSLNDIVALLRELLRTPIEVQHVAPRPFDVPASVLEIGRARTRLDWSPRIGLREGVEQVVAELRAEAEAACELPWSYTATSRATSSAPRPMREASRASLRVVGTSLR